MNQAIGSSAMTSRERMLATLKKEPVDRFPVWLKMANSAWRSLQPEPYRSMDGTQLLRDCGCDIISGCGFGAQASRPHVESSSRREGNLRKLQIKTPDGILASVDVIDPLTGSSHPSEYLVNNADQLKALRWFHADTSYKAGPDQIENAKAKQRDLAQADMISSSGIGPSPLMHLVQHICGPMNAIYLMADEPALFDEILDIMHQDRLKELKARLDGLTSDTFWLTENTSTTLISPTMFERICVPQLTVYGEMVLEHNIIPVHHMCGTLNALLEAIDGLPAMANEAYTTPPVGDTTLAEGRTRMPSKSLIGGTNASLWLAPAEVIIQAVAADVANCPDRLGIFLTSAGVLPAQVTFEKAKAVVAGFKELSTA